MHSPSTTRTDSTSRTPAAIADRVQDLVANPATGTCVGATLCLLAVRRVRGLDLLLGAVGAGLLYRSLDRRRQERAGESGRSVARSGQGLAPTPADRHTPATPAGSTSATPALDGVDEASEDSFPGSDPPAFTGTSASRAVAIEH